MYPVLIDWGPLFLPAWHALFVMGAIAAYFYLLYLRKRFYPELPAKQIAMVYFWAYFGGYFGARAFSILVEQPELERFWEKLAALVVLGPMTFYGGFIGAALLGAAYCLWRRLSIAKVADLAVPAGMLGLAYGRIGCFLNGDDYGVPVPAQHIDAWWAVTFPNLGDFVPRYPIQLIESLAAILIVGVSLVAFRPLVSKLGPGSVALVTSMLYAIYRFFGEFYRGDPRGELFSGALSPSQYISVGILIVATMLLVVLYGLRRGRALQA